MSLIEKVQAVEAVFADLNAAVAAFQVDSALYCNIGCGKCCFKPDIEATVLEFLPLAHYLYRHDLALAWLEKEISSNQGICLVLNPERTGAGLCSEYRYRGLICRLFGYSARINKYGARELVTCGIIKTEQEQSYKLAREKVASGAPVPVISQYYMKLHAIDPVLAQDFYPINQAIKKAIETVLHYYAYRN